MFKANPVRRTRCWPAVVVALVMLPVFAPAVADAAPRNQQATISFDAHVERVKHRKDVCRLTGTVTNGTVTMQQGTLSITGGTVRMSVDCADLIVPDGADVSTTVDALVSVSTSMGGTPDGVRVRRLPEQPIDVSVTVGGVTTEMGGNPDGFRMSVATVGGGSPQG